MDKSGNVVVYINFNSAKNVTPVAPVINRGDIAAGYVEVQGTQSVKNPAVRDEALIKATVSGILEPAVLVENKDRFTITGGNTIEAISFEWDGIATEENHKAIDLDDFHFGRTDDCDKVNWNAVVKYTVPAEAQRVYDIRNDCIITGLYDNHSHNAEDPEVCDLIKKVTFPIDATKIAMPTWADMQIPTGFEAAEYVLECHDSTVTGTGLPCGCTFNVEGTVASFNFGLTEWEKQFVIDALNAYYAYHPTVTYIEVEFWDSNATMYQFQVEVYAYARVTSVTDVYGHTNFILAGIEYAADVVGAYIMPAWAGAGFDYTGADRPIDAPYMDTEVNVIANAANPEFGVIREEKGIVTDTKGEMYLIHWDSKLGYKYTGKTSTIPAGKVAATAFLGGLWTPDGTILAAAGTTVAAPIAYEGVWFDLVPSAVTGVNWHAVFPAYPSIPPIFSATVVPVTIHKVAPPNDVTFLEYYYKNSRP